MKKNILCLVVLIVMLLNTFVYASTNTYERTEENLQIHSSIEVTNKVKRAALATPKVNAEEKIYDFADLFSSTEEQDLYNAVIQYINRSNMDMAIVTIDYNNKASSQDYADDFYDYNDFGRGSTFDGILFLIDMDNRMMHISTTGNAILYYDDYRIDIMLDEVYDYISKQQYFETAYSFINNAENFFVIGKPSSNKDYTINNNGEYIKEDPSNFWMAITLAGFVTFVFVGVTNTMHNLVKEATNAKNYLVNNSFQLTNQYDTFLRTNTVKTYCPPTSSSSGGSSSHRSSSGRSHGGGSRRF